MKKVLFIALIALLVSLAGCEKESDPQYYGFGVVQPSSSGLTILTDDDHVLYGPAIATSEEIKAGDRVYFLYTIDKEGLETDSYDYLVSWDDIYKVPTKDIRVINDVSRDTIGTSGIRINSVWIARQYLNVDLTFWGYNKTHYLNLVYDPLSQTEEGAVVLEFKHKDNDDYQMVGKWGLMSFDLNSIDWVGTAPHKIIFKYKDYYSVVNSLNLSYTPPVE